MVSRPIIIGPRMPGEFMGRTASVEPYAVEFGERVGARRTELAWSQERLGAEAGLHFTYVSSVERGERNVSLRTILHLSAALDMDAGVLVTELPPPL